MSYIVSLARLRKGLPPSHHTPDFFSNLLIVYWVTACNHDGGYSPITEVRWGHGICDTIWNSGRCAATIERATIGSASSTIRGTADSICFRGNGWKGCIGRTMGDPMFQGHARYIGTLDNPPFHVLWVQYYEGSDVRLIHVHTGSQLVIDDNPVPSPSGERVAVAAGDLDAQYGPNRFTNLAPAG